MRLKLTLPVLPEPFTVELENLAHHQWRVSQIDAATDKPVSETAEVQLTPLYQTADRYGWLVLVNHRPVELHAIREATGLHFWLEAQNFECQRFVPLNRQGALRPHGDGILRAIMPGKIVETMVKVGDLVEANQVVMVMEAMKMENEIKAPGKGVVLEIPVNNGQSVEIKTVLIRMTVE